MINGRREVKIESGKWISGLDSNKYVVIENKNEYLAPINGTQIADNCGSC